MQCVLFAVCTGTLQYEVLAESKASLSGSMPFQVWPVSHRRPGLKLRVSPRGQLRGVAAPAAGWQATFTRQDKREKGKGWHPEDSIHLAALP